MSLTVERSVGAAAAGDAVPVSNEAGCSSSPTVTVGIPAYCNEGTIARAIESVLAQTYANFRLLIADDRSSDATFSICEEYAARDPRITVVRNEQNLYFMNFGALVERAESEYFVWLAGDDYWRPEFLRACIDQLEARPDIVCCAPKCLYTSENGLTLALGTYTILGEHVDMVQQYLRRIVDYNGDNCRMYGVYRTQALSQCLPPSIMHAWDLALCAATFRFGGYLELPQVLMIRDRTPHDSYVQSVVRDHRSFLFRWFPALKLTLHLIFSGRVPLKARIVSPLLKLNWNHHIWHVQHFHPRFERATRRLYTFVRRRVIWRLQAFPFSPTGADSGA